MVDAVVEGVDASHEMRQDFRAEIDGFLPEAGEKVHDRRRHYVNGAIGQVPGRVFDFFVERPDDTAFVDFDYPAGLRLRGVESHHRYFDTLSLFFMPPDESSDIEGGQIVRMHDH